MKAIGHLCMKLTGIGIAIFVFSFLVSQISASSLLYGQTVGFTGTQTTLPASGLNAPEGVAVDSAGNVFIADTDNSRVLELPKTATGYGAQTALPFSGVYHRGVAATGIAVDSVGDVFIADYETVGSGGIADSDGLRGADDPAVQRPA